MDQRGLPVGQLLFAQPFVFTGQGVEFDVAGRLIRDQQGRAGIGHQSARGDGGRLLVQELVALLANVLGLLEAQLFGEVALLIDCLRVDVGEA